MGYICPQREENLIAVTESKGLDYPKTPDEFLICCDCKDNCTTEHCTCKKTTWDDNRKEK